MGNISKFYWIRWGLKEKEVEMVIISLKFFWKDKVLERWN